MMVLFPIVSTLLFFLLLTLSSADEYELEDRYSSSWWWGGGTGAATASGNQGASLRKWQTCDVFMAPTNSSTGWGVFAARDFDDFELMDPTPLHLSFRTLGDAPVSERRLIKSTALDDYIYGYRKQGGYRDEDYFALVMFGYGMVYNHHPTNPHIQLGVGSGYPPSWYSRRKIRAGEEVYSSYGQDGGKSWFEGRDLTVVHGDLRLTSDQLNFLSSQYCTKIYALAAPKNAVKKLPSLDESRLAPFDAGLYDARAKVQIKLGERIEIGPALLMYKPFLKDSAMAGLVITWDAMLPEHQEPFVVASRQMNGKIPIQYQGVATQGERVWRPTSLENVAILPFAGRIGMVRRVGHLESANCRLKVDVKVVADGGGKGQPSVLVVLELIATRDISVGEVLTVNLNPAGTESERRLLQSQLSNGRRASSSQW